MNRNEENRSGYQTVFKTIDKSYHTTNVIHCISLIFTSLIVYLALTGEFVFFTWHPILMSIGWMLLMTEGILSLNKHNIFLKNWIGSNRVFIHWSIQSLALIAITSGFLIAFQSKNSKNKPHFKSWHALFGLLGVIFAIPSGFNGLLTLYNKDLKDYYSPKLNKFIHIVVGTLAYLFGGISAILSVYTKWFDRKIGSNYTIFVISLTLSSFIVIWTLVKPVKSVSNRFQNLISM